MAVDKILFTLQKKRNNLNNLKLSKTKVHTLVQAELPAFSAQPTEGTETLTSAMKPSSACRVGNLP